MAKRKLDKLQPGQTVWEIYRQKMGNTTISRRVLGTVKVIEVDLEKRRVLANWGGNSRPSWYSEKAVSKWKLIKPEPKGKILGMDTY